MKNLFRLFGILLLFVTASQAATVIAAGTKTVQACSFAVNPAAQIVSQLPYPTDWKVVVVCNEVMWDRLMKQANVNYLSDYAFTYQPNHVTFVRAKWFGERGHYTPAQILSHELGHIMCKCDNEDRAWDWANRHGLR